MKKVLFIITLLIVISSCDVLNNSSTSEQETEYTGLRSVVDDESWVDYLTGSVWVAKNETIGLSNNIDTWGLFYFEEDQTQIFYIANYLTAIMWGASGEGSFQSKFKIEDDIMFINSEDDGSFIKYTLLERGDETFYSREMNLKFYTDGELNGIEQTYSYNITPTNPNPEVLSDVIEGDLYAPLNNSSWTSGPYSCDVLINQQSKLFDKSEFNDWYSTEYRYDLISYTYDETRSRVIISSEELVEYLSGDDLFASYPEIFIELEMFDVFSRIVVEDPDSVFYTDSSINEKLDFNPLDDGSYEIIYYTDKTTVYPDEILDITESDYYIDIEFNESDHEIDITVFKEDLEIFNYTQSFYIIDNMMFNNSLFGLDPIYTVDITGDNLNLTSFDSTDGDDLLELNFTKKD